jgi:hypothetical protein
MARFGNAGILETGSKGETNHTLSKIISDRISIWLKKGLRSFTFCFVCTLSLYSLLSRHLIFGYQQSLEVSLVSPLLVTRNCLPSFSLTMRPAWILPRCVLNGRFRL